MNIGFDLDKVLINFPPLIPSNVIRKLYGQKLNGHLSYRFPSIWEQIIRRATHTPLLRKPIQKNIQLLWKNKKKANQKFFLISSRYGFLRDITEELVKKNNFPNLFNKLYFNYQNKQPHLFKSSIIAKEHIDAYIDDDLPLLVYLAGKHPKTNFLDYFKKI